MENSSKQIRNNKGELNACSIQFLDELLQKSYQFAQHLDTQTDILVGVSSAIFLFSLSRFLDAKGEIPFLILAVFTGLSSLVGLFAIHPPRFMRKRGQEESLMYHKHIMSFSSPAEYGRQLLSVIDDEDRIIKEYATEIYNVSKYYYRPKRRLFHVARNLLMTGILLGFVSFMIELLFSIVAIFSTFDTVSIRFLGL